MDIYSAKHAVPIMPYHSLTHVVAAASAEVYTAEHCHITELVNTPALPCVSLARARVERGATTALHALAYEEIYVIERGSGIMEGGDGQRFAVRAGDSVRIPAGVPQRIANTGADELVFLCLCLPRFETCGYTDLEVEGEPGGGPAA